jgi:hypothetical protein
MAAARRACELFSFAAAGAGLIFLGKAFAIGMTVAGSAD